MAFIGLVEDYDEYKEKHKEDTGSVMISGTGNIISSDDMGPIELKDLIILQQTRLRNDAYTVYMQSNLDFFDVYYSLDVNEQEDAKLLQLARGIRRIYKRYDDYDVAVRIREDYMDWLVDKYGGEELFEFSCKSGLMRDWIPPFPLFSRTAPAHEYEMYLQGGPDLEINEFDDERLVELLKIIGEEMDIPPEKLQTVGGVETSLYVRDVKLDTKDVKSKYRTSSSDGAVSTGDIEQLQQLFRSWYQPEVTEDKKEESNERFFKKSKESIEEEYYMNDGILFDKDSISESFRSGYRSDDDDYDPDEMVTDPITKRPMTRSELGTRQFIRQMASSGWNEMRLMRAMSVGSKFELRSMEAKMRNRKISKKKAKSMMSDIIGDNSYDVMSSIDELDKYLFDD